MLASLPCFEVSCEKCFCRVLLCIFVYTYGMYSPYVRASVVLVPARMQIGLMMRVFCALSSFVGCFSFALEFYHDLSGMLDNFVSDRCLYGPLYSTPDGRTNIVAFSHGTDNNPVLLCLATCLSLLCLANSQQSIPHCAFDRLDGWLE